MKFSQAITATVLATYSELTLAVPSPQVNDPGSLYPASIQCGGFPGVSPPDYNNLNSAAVGLYQGGGVCQGPTGSGECIRVACDNTSGIWLCNTDGSDGPYSPQCTDVAAYVYRGEDDGDQETDIWWECRDADKYTILEQVGQAFDKSGNWNVVTAYANCNKDPSLGPSEQ